MPRRWGDEADRQRLILDALGDELYAVLKPALDAFGEDAARLVARDGFDPSAVFTAGDGLRADLDRVVDVDIRRIAEDAAGDVDLVPAASTLIADHLRGARNRLVNVPDHVYARVKALVLRATTDGWENERLAGEIDNLLTGEGQDTWAGRAVVIARTEAVSAHNAGTFAGMLAMAEVEGGEFEKVWLATEDTRTRPTHRRADGQRVPLAAPFRVGGAELMYPGDPSGPPQECIQCRCTLLMLEPGEEIDMTGRGFTDPDDWGGWE